MHSMYVINAYKRLLADIRDKTGVSIDAPGDLNYDWVLIEGPKLDKEILAYLEGERESVDLPEWLKPLWTGFLERGCLVCLRELRQSLVFCYKVEHEPTNEQLIQSQKDFEETESLVKLWSDSRNDYLIRSHTIGTARKYISSILYRANWREIVPSHGPGGIYPSRVPCDKSRFTTIYRSIQDYYPYDQFFCGLPNYWVDTMVEEKIGSLTECDDIVAKLVAVPKDSRGPRLICVHPAESIWIQQGQRRILESCIERHPLTRGRINFTDQTVNGTLALKSSKDREFCTLDLKEASDRISCSLVRSLFGDYIYDWISCARANKLELLDGRVIPLQKWAPMGNALTFPIESLVFWSVVRAGIYTSSGEICDDVYVFGDDIISD